MTTNFIINFLSRSRLNLRSAVPLAEAAAPPGTPVLAGAADRAPVADPWAAAFTRIMASLDHIEKKIDELPAKPTGSRQVNSY